MSGTDAIRADEIGDLRGMLERSAARRTGDPFAAEDLAQETITRVLNAIRVGTRPTSGVRAFAYGVLRHVVADWWRTRGRETELAYDPAGDDWDPLNQMIRDEALVELDSAMDRLDDADREILVASFYEGLPSREVARRLRTPGPTVRQRKRRALKKLRASIDLTVAPSLADLAPPASGLGEASVLPCP